MARGIGQEREKSLPMGYPRARRERRLPPPKPYSMRELRRYGRKAQPETITGPWDFEDGAIVDVGSVVPTHRDGKMWFDPAAGQQVAVPGLHGPTHEDGGSDEFSLEGLSGDLGDPQDAKAHQVSHQDGGPDEIDVTGLSGELLDAHPPKAHKTSHQDGGGDEISLAGLSGEAADPQPPKAHKASHEDGGADPLDVKDVVDSEGRLLTGTQKTDLTDGGATGLHFHEEAHIHAYKEDKSRECDGAKTVFITAQQFQPYTVRVVLNGLEKVDGLAKDYEEGAMRDSFIMAVAPSGGDTLVAHYLAERA